MKISRILPAALLGMALLGMLAAAGIYFYVLPQLPATDTLRDVRFQVPLRIYTADERLIAEFGEKRRIPVKYENLPPRLVQAFLAAEDDRFFEHPGVDYQGLVRAALQLIRTGRKTQGGSTITMQVARNFFLSREKTYLRKLTEILLALKIERELSKEQILELYLNKIYLGQRAYGVAAAARIYYGTDLDGLTLAQMATIAGLPKAPSRDNPVSNPERARIRRDYVLRRMRELGYIDAETYQGALAEPLSARLHAATTEVEAPFLAEMVRTELVGRYGEATYTQGYRVYTTIDSDRQAAANRALRRALLAYDRRHGYRGPERRIDLPADIAPEQAARELRSIPSLGGLPPALVLSIDEKSFEAVLRDGRVVQVDWEGMAWARPDLGENRLGPKPKTASDILARGDLIRLEEDGDAWRLAQPPKLEGALVSLNPDDGAIQALAGGFDFRRSKFNRAVQARRQPGSSFKPVIYSAALEKGFTAASVLNDAPVVFDDPALERAWRPENYSGRFYGPTRLRVALTHSRNLVSIRLLRAIGVRYAIDYARRFGFSPDQLPADLSLALGSGSVTPLQMARAYAVLANGGFLITPYYISRIEDSDGQVLFRAEPALACREPCQTDAAETVDDPPADSLPPPRLAERTLEPRNVWLMNSMLRDVIRRGTGRRALVLGRKDLHGKTGTTNDQRDAWFCGFSPALVTVSWVGFDSMKPLGRGETGGRAALPMWIDYMREALAGVPEIHRDPPPGLVTVRIDPATGLRARADQPDALFETFREEYVPRETAAGAELAPVDGQDQETTEPLF